MRPDQRQAIGVLAALEAMRDKLAYSYGLAYRQEPQEAIDAVAEYIAANDEYDAAGEAVDQWFAGPGTAEDNVEKALAIASRFEAAEVRRAAAHARMKGETK